MEIVKTKALVHTLILVDKNSLEKIADMFGRVDNIWSSNLPAILFNCDLHHVDPQKFSGIDLVSFMN